MPPVDRPLRLGELLAETVRLYGERVWAALGLGALVAAGLVLVVAVPHDAGRIPIVALVFTAAYAAAVRLTSGDPFREAWAQVGLRLPVLLVLTLVVSVPFAIGRYDPVLFFVAVFWLGLTGFSIPVAMLERDPAA